jgi:hypothetical protein
LRQIGVSILRITMGRALLDDDLDAGAAVTVEEVIERSGSTRADADTTSPPGAPRRQEEHQHDDERGDPGEQTHHNTRRMIPSSSGARPVNAQPQMG